MDLEMNKSTNICVACLSDNRKLTIIDKSKLFHCIQIIFNDNNIFTQYLSVCWECLSVLSKMKKFIEQVKKSVMFMHQLHNLKPCLSKLVISETEYLLFDMNNEIKMEMTSRPKNVANVKIEDEIDNANFYESDFNDSDEEPLTKHATNITGLIPEVVERDEKLMKSKENILKVKIKNVKSKRKTKIRKINKKSILKLEQLNMNKGEIAQICLSWDEVQKERLKVITSQTYKQKDYKCDNCALTFNHSIKYDNHMKKHQYCSTKPMCDFCKSTCANAKALAVHMRRHLVRWRCSLCGALSSRASVAADHFAKTHGSSTNHVCRLCGQSFGKLSLMLKHNTNEHKTPVSCDVCGKTYKGRSALKSHLFTHEAKREFNCNKCEKSFLYKKLLLNHLDTHEGSLENYYCHECDLSFKHQITYLQHIKYSLKHVVPSKIKYKCDLCEKRFVYRSRLEDHKIAVHLKLKQFSCSEAGCVFKCSTRPVLRTHMRMVHRNKRLLRNYICDKCGKTYPSKNSLTSHINTHTGIRPYKCDLCSATFGYDAALYNHRKLVHKVLKHKLTD